MQQLHQKGHPNAKVGVKQDLRPFSRTTMLAGYGEIGREAAFMMAY